MRALNDPTRESRTPSNSRRGLSVRRAISLLETVIAMVILGGALVALLDTVGSARKTQAAATERQFGMILAENMIAEALYRPMYMEDNSFGPEVDEITGNRSAFDDVDDYSGWSSTPPVDRDGVVIPGAEGYTRSVVVQFRQLDRTGRNASSDEGVLVVKVTIYRGDREVAELRGLRTDVWTAPDEGY